MEEVTDPEELAKAQAQRQRFDRNFAWFRDSNSRSPVKASIHQVFPLVFS
jgi:hypothetical protein